MDWFQIIIVNCQFIAAGIIIPVFCQKKDSYYFSSNFGQPLSCIVI
ncbi:hypothetical protein OIU79_013234 [Salix purpurea]|uniref:Uncharacterized protein n=1 Tax=Salix purpurea TaxID=77065 RepID=A0A9Q0T4D6_SALPP|nr:hypothetical protein OIU79_013234 [Salix purpurea]